MSLERWYIRWTGVCNGWWGMMHTIWVRRPCCREQSLCPLSCHILSDVTDAGNYISFVALVAICILLAHNICMSVINGQPDFQVHARCFAPASAGFPEGVLSVSPTHRLSVQEYSAVHCH